MRSDNFGDGGGNNEGLKLSRLGSHDSGMTSPRMKKPLYDRGFMERRGIEPRFAECDSAVIPLDHRPGEEPI